MKTFGMLLVFFSSSCFGWQLSSRLHRRVKALDYFIRAVEGIREEIRFLHSPVPRLMERLGKDPRFVQYDFFKSVSKEMHERLSLCQAFEKSLKIYMHDFCLNKSDADIIIRFAGALGGSDLEGQENLCSFTLRELKQQKENAAAYCGTHAKTYRLLGVVAGLFVCLMLL